MDNNTDDFGSFLTFLVSFRNPAEIWKNHPSFLIVEYIVYFCTLMTVVHAVKSGGRFKFLWLATLFHGLTVELVSYFIPDIDNFWHGQSTIMFLDNRLPLYIVCLYPFFIYSASVATHHLNLKAWVRPFAVGLGVVLIDLPFDIVGIKQLWWTWHDTDPNIYDRMYWVPWNSYYFHAAFASSLTFLLQMFRYLMTGSCEMHHYSSFFKELLCSMLTGLFSMGVGILQFMPIYHPLHDLYGIPTQVCVLMLLSLYFIIVWKADRNTKGRSNVTVEMKSKSCLLLSIIVISNATMFFITLFCDPAEINSIGLHEQIGPCDKTTDVLTPIGKVLSKRTFLCTTDFDEAYFDFHCLPSGKPPGNGVDWYTVCGTPYPNKAEYLAIVGTVCFLSLIVYHEIFRRRSVKNSFGNINESKKRM